MRALVQVRPAVVINPADWGALVGVSRPNATSDRNLRPLILPGSADAACTQITKMQMRINTTPHIPWAWIPGAELTARGFCTVPSDLHNTTGGSRPLGRQRLER